MKKSMILCVFALVGSLFVAQNRLIFAAGGVVDGNAPSAAALEKTFSANIVVNGVSHVANGVALRNRTSGWIPLRGVPDGSTVEKALLYWNFSDARVSGSVGCAALFNGNRVNGTKRADNADPCWNMAGNHTYRANVTEYIPSDNPNQDYEVVIIFNGTTSTTGQHPWSPVETQNIRLDGATLVVIYSNESTSGKIVRIYDGLNGSEFSGGAAKFTLTHAATSGTGLFTMSGADGQRGSGHDNDSNISNEKTTFNGTQIAGTPTAASDWDGSTGLPLPQLWDVHTHTVTLSGTSSVVEYTAGTDCLVPVVFILEK